MNGEDWFAIMVIIAFALIVIFVICQPPTVSNTLQYYNENDQRDFDKYNDVFSFEVCQLKQFPNWTKESSSSGGWFLFIGGYSQSLTEKENLNYYTYIKDKTGAIYFFKISADKVRIYEDAKDNQVYICAKSLYVNNTTRDNIGQVNTYTWFNIHIPEGTIIQKIDKIDIDNFVKK